MGLLNIALWVAGRRAHRARLLPRAGRRRATRRSRPQDANVARYESWRGGIRDDGKTGASVAMAVLRRQTQIGAGIAIVGVVLVFLGVRDPLDPGACGQPRRRSAGVRSRVQRSMTTARPASWAIRAASQFTTPSCSHRHRAPGRHGLTRMRAHARGAGRRRPCRTARSLRRPPRASGSGHAEDSRTFGLTGTHS